MNNSQDSNRQPTWFYVAFFSTVAVLVVAVFSIILWGGIRAENVSDRCEEAFPRAYDVEAMVVNKGSWLICRVITPDSAGRITERIEWVTRHGDVWIIGDR